MVLCQSKYLFTDVTAGVGWAGGCTSLFECVEDTRVVEHVVQRSSKVTEKCILDYYACYLLFVTLDSAPAAGYDAAITLLSLPGLRHKS